MAVVNAIVFVAVVIIASIISSPTSCQQHRPHRANISRRQLSPQTKAFKNARYLDYGGCMLPPRYPLATFLPPAEFVDFVEFAALVHRFKIDSTYLEFRLSLNLSLPPFRHDLCRAVWRRLRWQVVRGDGLVSAAW